MGNAIKAWAETRCGVHFCHQCGRNVEHLRGKPGDRDSATEALELIGRYQLTVCFTPSQWVAYQPGRGDLQGAGETPAEAVQAAVNAIIRSGGERPW